MLPFVDSSGDSTPESHGAEHSGKASCARTREEECNRRRRSVLLHPFLLSVKGNVRVDVKLCHNILFNDRSRRSGVGPPVL